MKSSSPQLINFHLVPASQGQVAEYRIGWDQSAGTGMILHSILVLPTPAGNSPLHVRHDERADRAVIATAPEAYMAMVVLTRLHLLALEQVAGRDVKPAGNSLHQLIAGDREAIHVAAAG
jgi:hypothetical protein